MGWSEAGLSCGGWALVTLFLARFFISSMLFLSWERTASWMALTHLAISTAAYWFVGSSLTVSSYSVAASWLRRSASAGGADVSAAARSDFAFSKWVREAL